jgi:hypothetical protein
MKNPGRFLRAAMDRRRLPQIVPARMCLLLAAGLGVAAILTVGSRDRDTGKRVALSRVEPTPGKRPGHRARATDPARALAAALTLGDRSERESRVRDLLSAWAIQDAEEALRWVSSLEDPAARRSARSTVCSALAEKDPRQAVTLALAHGADEDDGGGLLECLTMRWCEREREAVLDWAREQPPGEWRERLLGRVSFVLSKSDPVSGLEPGTVQDEAAMAVLHQWALQDSAAALQWAEGFAETSLRDRAIEEITNIRNWAASSQEVK